ncbi:MAG: hypothetical protein JWP97_5403 [Labilithrix sp.]|nr:hypothetical protein [Labilithrix sp.]
MAIGRLAYGDAVGRVMIAAAASKAWRDALDADEALLQRVADEMLDDEVTSFGELLEAVLVQAVLEHETAALVAAREEQQITMYRAACEIGLHAAFINLRAHAALRERLDVATST